jgi:hypothetical protein
MKSKFDIRSLLDRRESVIDQMLDLFPMIPGAFKEVFRKCGKPNCWCSSGSRGHSLRRITWSEQGKAHSKAVPDEQLDWFIIATENYREFQQLKKQIAELDRDIVEELEQYALCQVAKSRFEREHG